MRIESCQYVHFSVRKIWLRITLQKSITGPRQTNDAASATFFKHTIRLNIPHNHFTIEELTHPIESYIITDFKANARNFDSFSQCEAYHEKVVWIWSKSTVFWDLSRIRWSLSIAQKKKWTRVNNEKALSVSRYRSFLSREVRFHKWDFLVI